MVFTYQVTCNVEVNFTCLMWLLESGSYYISGQCGPSVSLPMSMNRAHLCRACMSVLRCTCECAQSCVLPQYERVQVCTRALFTTASQ